MNELPPEHFQKIAVNLLKRRPGARFYALTPESQTALAAFTKAYRDVFQTA